MPSLKEIGKIALVVIGVMFLIKLIPPLKSFLS